MPIRSIHVLSGLQRKVLQTRGWCYSGALRSELGIDSVSRSAGASSSPIRADLESKAGASLKVDVV